MEQAASNSISPILEALLKSIKAQTTFNQRLAQVQDTDVEAATLTKQCKQAIKRAEWVSVLLLMDSDIARLRCTSAPDPRVYKKPQGADDLDFSDYLICLTKLSSMYLQAGHANLGLQTVHLMQAALVESATKTRVSVIRACERLRKQTTGPNVVWDSDSLNRSDVRVLLEPLQRRFVGGRNQLLSSNRKRRFQATETPFREKSGSPDETFRTKGGGLPLPADGTSRIRGCTHWQSGRICPYEPSCRFRHS